jgi:hypothetical protein
MVGDEKILICQAMLFSYFLK